MNPNTILHGKTLGEWATLLASTSKTKLIKETANFDRVKYDEVKAAVEGMEVTRDVTPPHPDPLPEEVTGNTPSADEERATEEQHVDALADQPADSAVETIDDTPSIDPVTIQAVFRELAKNVPEATGYMKRSPTPRLTPAQCMLQSRLATALENLGVKLGSQDKVYPWLLDQIAKTLGE